MSVQEGLNGSLAINGTVIAALTEVTFEHTRPAKEWIPLGSATVVELLWGVNKFTATAKHAYIDSLYATLVTGGSALPGTLYPVNGKTIGGTFACVRHGISGIQMESNDPVIEDLDFIVYNVTFS
jgi:hypothetical protein